MELSDVKLALERHKGSGTGLTAAKLVAEITGNPEPNPALERQLRRMIAHLRYDGLAICGHPSSGYFLAESAEEMEGTCRFLRSRALHSLVQEARLRKISMPRLLGQLLLDMDPPPQELRRASPQA